MREWQVIQSDHDADPSGPTPPILKQLPSDSIDALVTDPPAGIGFMAREWDSNKGGRVSWVSWLEGILRECLRVLKPGAHGLIWAIPRTSHWTATAAELAGFEIRDVITHHFGTGFPKSLNVSKAIDQTRVEDQEPIRVVCRFVRAAMDRYVVTSKVLAPEFDCDPRLIDHWAARDTDSQPNLPTPEQWARLKEIFEFNDPAVDAEVARLNERKGERGDTWKSATIIDEIGAPAAGGVVTSFLHSEHPDRSVREPSEAAARWDGWGTALKPATEHWILVRKPLAVDGASATVAANVQAHGTGGLNIDACRIAGVVPSTTQGQSNHQGDIYGADQRDKREFTPADGGRWPANLVLSHTEWCEPIGTTVVRGDNRTERGQEPGQDDGHFYEVGGGGRGDAPGAALYGDAEAVVWRCLPGCPVALLDAQSGSLKAGGKIASGTRAASTPRGNEILGADLRPRDEWAGHGDTGGASRFFYVSKPSGKEREAGLDHLPKRSGGDIVDRAEDSAGIQNPRAGAGRTSKGRANFHPTVKSIGLMSWLVKLITPPGGTILDPFTGSGSTGCAAVLGGWDFLGIEKDPDFVRIADARIAHYAAKGTEVGAPAAAEAA